MTTRRQAVLALVATALPGKARAQRTMARIGLLWLGSPDVDFLKAALLERLREHGYLEGRSLVIEDRTAPRRYEELLEAALDLARAKVQVIVTYGATSVRAARRATSTIPVIMITGIDPVKEGLAASLGRPGGNVTGLSTLTSELHGKSVELVRQTLPGARRVGTLVSPTSDAGMGNLEKMREEGRRLGLELHALEVRAAAELEPALAEAARSKLDAILIVPSTLFLALRTRIAQLTLQHRLPCFAYAPEFSDAGALAAYGFSRERTFRRAADYADRILKGAQPAEMPIERAAEFELVVNLRTAKALGLSIPQALLLRATRTID
jgi:putative tryptophan/tyrosine transport system substrate-binding protein